jgi:hypothetical protein
MHCVVYADRVVLLRSLVGSQGDQTLGSFEVGRWTNETLTLFSLLQKVHEENVYVAHMHAFMVAFTSSQHHVCTCNVQS